MIIDPTLALVAIVSFLLGSLLLPVTTSITANLLTPRVNRFLEKLADRRRGESLRRLKEEYELYRRWRENPDEFELHVLYRIATGIPQFKDIRLARDIQRVMKFEEYEREALARIRKLENQATDVNEPAD